MSESVCISYLLVRAITHQPFKLGSLNLDQRCKTPWLRSLLFWGTIDFDLQGQIRVKIPNLPHYGRVPTITRHLLKLESPNLDQRCKTHWLRSLLFWRLIDIDLHVNSEIWNLIFLQNLFALCLFYYLVRPFLVNISKTITGDQSNRSPLLTKREFCRKSWMSNPFDNWYCCQFIHMGRQIFAVNCRDDSVCNPDCTRERACTYISVTLASRRLPNMRPR